MHRIMSFGTDYRDSVGMSRAKDSQRCVSAHWRRIWVWNWRILRTWVLQRAWVWSCYPAALLGGAVFLFAVFVMQRPSLQLELPWNKRENTWKVTLWIFCRWWKVKLSLRLRLCRSQHRLRGDGRGGERCCWSAEGFLRRSARPADPLQSAPGAGGGRQ